MPNFKTFFNVLNKAGEKIGYSLERISKMPKEMQKASQYLEEIRYNPNISDEMSRHLITPALKNLKRINVGKQRIIPIDANNYKQQASHLLESPIVQHNMQRTQEITGKSKQEILDSYKQAADKLAGGYIVNSAGQPIKIITYGDQQYVPAELIISGMTSDAPVLSLASRGLGSSNPFYKSTNAEGGLVSLAGDTFEAMNYSAPDLEIIASLFPKDKQMQNAIKIINDLHIAKNIKEANKVAVRNSKSKYVRTGELSKDQLQSLTPSMTVGKTGMFNVSQNMSKAKYYVPWDIDELTSYRTAQEYINRRLHESGLWNLGGLSDVIIDPRNLAKADAEGAHYLAPKKYEINSKLLKDGNIKVFKPFAGENSVEGLMNIEKGGLKGTGIHGLQISNIYNPTPMTYIGIKPKFVLGTMKKGGKLIKKINRFNLSAKMKRQ